MSYNAQTDQNTTLVIRHPKSLPFKYVASGDGRGRLAAMATYLNGLANGAGAGQNEVDAHTGSTAAAPAVASATVVFATSSGTVGCVINGVTETVTWATSDTVSMTALMAVIVADTTALVGGYVNACNLAGTIALASVAAGDQVTIDVVTFTARNGGALGPAEFDMSGSNNADATALKNAINAHPYLRNKVLASVSSATITVRQLSGTTGLAVNSPAATFTLGGLSSGLLAAVATGIVSSTQKSALANCFTFTATGTNVTIGGSLTRLGGGVGGDASATPLYF